MNPAVELFGAEEEEAVPGGRKKVQLFLTAVRLSPLSAVTLSR